MASSPSTSNSPAGTSSSSCLIGTRNCRTRITSRAGVIGTTATALYLRRTSHSPIPGHDSVTTERYRPANATRDAAGSGIGGRSARHDDPLAGAGAFAPVRDRGTDEFAEQRVRPCRTRPEFGVELAGHEERVVR